MKKNRNKILYLFVLLLLLASCNNDEECRKSRYVTMKIGFYHSSLDSITHIRSIVPLSVDSLSVNGIGNDSMLYNNNKKLTTISLPLKKNSVQTDFKVQFNNITDTITILHQDSIQYLSLECGCIKTFVIDTVLTTNHFIDSVKISNHAVNTIDAEHIKIYH